MITTIKQVIFTDKRKDWQPLKNKAWAPFKMLHLELADGKWISKYYKIDDDAPEIEVGTRYNILFNKNWEYYNLVALYDVAKEWQDELDPDLQII